MKFNTFHLTFDKGIDTKSDPMLVKPPYLLTCNNGVLIRASTWTTRNGATTLPQTIAGGGTITGAQTLGVFSGDPNHTELLLFNAGQGYSWAPGGSAWISKGALTPVTLTETTVMRNTYQQSNPDCDSTAGITVFAWEDGRGGIYARAIDEVTGALYIADTQISSTGTRPKVVALPGSGIGQPYGVICILYAESSNLRFQSVNAANPTVLTAAVTVDTTMATSGPVLDATSQSGAAILAAWNDTNHHTRLAVISSTGTLSGPGFPTELNVATSCDKAVSVIWDSVNFRVWLGMASSTNFTAAVYDGSFAQVVAPVAIDSSTAVVNIAGVVAGVTMTFYYEITGSQTYNNLIETNTLTLSGVVGTKAVYQRSVGLASKVFSFGGNNYLWAVYASTLQGTTFLLQLVATTPNIVARGNSGWASGLYTAGVIPRVYSAASGMFTMPAVVRTQIINTVTVTNNVAGQTVGASGVPTAITTNYLNGVDRVDVTFSNPNQYASVQLSDNLHLTGGFLTAYDGQGFVEHGFHIYPDNVTAVANASGGSMADGTYSVVVVAYWTDAKGLLHRSAPSIPQTVTITGGGGSGSITTTIPTIRLTAKQGARTPIILAAFRSSTSQQTYLRDGNSGANPVTSPLYNSTTADTVTFTHTLADASIAANEILYTTGNVLENLVPPAASLIAASHNRLFLTGCPGQPSTVFYSQANQPGRPVEFCGALLSQQVPSVGGPNTAIQVMDGTVFVFKANSIWAFSGQGPDATGSTAANTFAPPTLVTSDVGCTIPQSMVVMRDGLMFMSAKGIYTLTRGLGCDYTGWQVEALNGQAVSSGVLVGGTNQVRFTSSNGKAVIYDYLFHEWSTWDGPVTAAADAVMFSGTWTYATSGGVVYQESPGVFLDGTVPVVMTTETAWLPMNGLNGFQSVMDIHFLGTFYSPHLMNAEIAYNFGANPSEVKQWNPGAVITSQQPYGAAVYGTETYGGAPVPPVNRWRAKPAIHKCNAIKLKFYPQAVAGKGYTLSGVDITWIGLDKPFPLATQQSI